MAEVKLNTVRREATGKGGARRTRTDGQVPAVLYGKGMEPISIALDRREFVTALHTDAGMNVLLNLQVDGSSILALTKDIQRDPVRGTLLHADFIQIDRTQKVEVEVPIHLVGDAPGVKSGGALEHPLFTVHVRCLATEVPESIDCDVSGLEIGETLRVSDLATGRTFEILNDPDLPVVTITAPITDEQLAAMEAGVVSEEAVAEEAAAAEAAAEAEDTEGSDTPTEGQ
ncbi:MAG TPA: 50S ribosomal protein L25/general stress protein Ctc [Actinomycetota bacterium]|nr:50S ribosomal protein L25/general stress protein Ctc [Actinomycetota bacterium]